MSLRLRAASVHLLTATGAAFALLALLAAARGDWQSMFVWLGVALVVDSIDGPLARRLHVTTVLPRWSGERLDLIVDFLTYVAVPAFAVSQADLLPQQFRLPAGIAILLSSLFHVADQESKTKEGYFVGFPAIWNVVCLYLFAFMPSPVVTALWAGAAIGAVANPFPSPLWVKVLLVVTAACLTGVGALRALRDSKAG